MSLSAYRVACAASSLVLSLVLLSCFAEPKRPPLDARFPKPSVTMGKAKNQTRAQTLVKSPASVIADAPSSPTATLPGPAVSLTLGDVLHTTLANNLAVRIQELNRQNARDEIDAARGIYDLQTNSRLNHSRSVFASRSSNGVTSTRSSGRTTVDTFSAGASQLLPSGGQVSLDYTAQNSETRSRSRSGAFSASSKSENDPQELALGVTQPLLRGFGPTVTNAPINIAKNDARISYEQFRLQLMQQLGGALRSYWDLIFAINNFDVQKVAMEQARELLRTNKVKYETGWSPITDVLQAQAQVADRQQSMLTAARQVQDVMDQLKNQMNIPRNIPEWRLQFIPLQKPTFFETAYDEDASMRLALLKRPEAIQSDLVKRNDLIRERVARNNTLPQLNVDGSLGLVDPGSGAGKGLDNYSAGLTFNYPLQNRTARARLRQARANVEVSDLDIEQTRQNILQQVRTSFRAIQIARQQIDVSRAAIEYETQKLQSERERYDVGIATSFELLSFQNDYALAQVRYLQAVVNYNKSLIDFEVDRGTLLDTLGIQIQNYGVSKANPADYYSSVNAAADKKAALGR